MMEAVEVLEEAVAVVVEAEVTATTMKRMTTK